VGKRTDGASLSKLLRRIEGCEIERYGNRMRHSGRRLEQRGGIKEAKIWWDCLHLHRRSSPHEDEPWNEPRKVYETESRRVSESHGNHRRVALRRPPARVALRAG